MESRIRRNVRQRGHTDVTHRPTKETTSGGKNRNSSKRANVSGQAAVRPPE